MSRLATTTVLLALAAGASSARAELDDVGTPIAPHGFPAYYAAGGLALEPCLPPPAGNAALRSDLCVFDPPAAPGGLGVGTEIFWWMAEASAPPLVPLGVAQLTLALEGAFTEERVVDGQQMSFLRLRVRVDVPVPGTYRVIHPFGTLRFENVTAEDGINYTADIGDIHVLDPAIGFAGALRGAAGPFLTWPGWKDDASLRVVDAQTGSVLEQYVGNPNVPHVVTGGSNGNSFRVELEGSSVFRTETDLWSVMGKVNDLADDANAHVYPPAPLPKLFAVGPVNRATTGGIADVVLQPDGVTTEKDYEGYPLGYPLWYQERVTVRQEDPAAPGTFVEVEQGGLKLTYCPPADPMCISFPVDPANPGSVEVRLGEEGFWWSAEASIEPGTTEGPVPAGLEGLLVLAMEMAFGGDESIFDGNQIGFARLRIRVDVPVAGRYRITHPYGVHEFDAVLDPDKGGRRAINFTSDVMKIDAADPDGAFTGALYGAVGPSFLTWPDFTSDPSLRLLQPVVIDGEPQRDGSGNVLRKVVQYVGNPTIPHVVTGSPHGTNWFRIEGPNGIDVRTRLFTVSGKVFDAETFEQVPDPDAPVAKPDAATLDLALASSVTIPVLQNDTYASGAPIAISVLPAGGGVGPDSGTVTVNADGTVTYTPAAGFGGVDTFAYRIRDASNITSVAAPVTVTVTPVETLAITLARFDVARLRLDVRGTSNFEGAIVSIHSATGGTPLGTAVVANGRWRWRGTVTGDVSRVSVVSSTGKASLVDQPVQAR
jgi:hypothetical protein